MLLAEGLARLGHAITVATPTAAAGCDDGRFPFTVVRRPSFFKLWRMIGNADTLQLAGPSFLPLFLGLLRRTPVVIEHHGYQAICPNGLLLHQPDRRACPGHFMAGAYRNCLRCVAATEGWLASFCKLLLTFARRWMCSRVAMNAPITRHVLDRLRLPRSRVIYYGISDSPPDNQPLISISPGPLCFAYVGRLVGEKGLPLLVEAAGRLRARDYDFRLRFVGDGPERTHLENLAAERGLDAVFTGFLGGDALQKATEDVAAVVMPSIWEETAGLAAMEHMMRGRPVIVSDIGGLGEVVDGAGLKFPVGDVDQLTACMQQILDRPEMINDMGHTARARALEMFRQDRMVEDHVRLYSTLSRGCSLESV
jgi:glycosyltransferase involved in cell wall biosynthesis